MKLLIYRDASGLGDWIMTCSVIKMINIQYPSLEIHVRLKNTTPLIREYLENSDIRVSLIYDTDRMQYNYISGHVIYPSMKKNYDYHFIEGMVKNLNEDTGLDIKYLPNTFAKCDYLFGNSELKDYILMPSCGTLRNRKCSGKEWGIENFKELNRLLARHYNVIQVGVLGDHVLSKIKKLRFNQNLQDLYNLFKHCRFFVGIVNGLCHFAGHHNVKSYVIYCGKRENFVYARYPNQLPIVENNTSPKEVYERILKVEKI